MINLSIWNKQTNLVLANGRILTPQDAFSDPNYSFAQYVTVVLEHLSDGRIGAIDSLDVLRQNFGVSSALSDEEALSEIEYIRNNPPTPNPDFAPLTRRDVQNLEQHITELELTILEAQNV